MPYLTSNHVDGLREPKQTGRLTMRPIHIAGHLHMQAMHLHIHAIHVSKATKAVHVSVALALASAAGGTTVLNSATVTPPPQTITGIVQTVVREHPTGATEANDTVKILRVGTKVVGLTDDSLTKTRDGSKVTVTVAAAPDGTKQVLSTISSSNPAPTPPPSPAASPTWTASGLLFGSAAAPTPPLPTADQLYVALVVPKGLAADPTLTDASVRAMVVNASAYWSSQSGGQVTISTARVLPQYTSAFVCSKTPMDMWNEALAKMPEATGVGKHLILVAPTGADKSGCSYGIANIGAIGSTQNLIFVAGLNQSQLSHEFGHNLGLQHSNSLRCGTAQDALMVSNAFPGCTAKPYDDLFDVMGFSGANYGEGNLNAVHLNGMGLLPTAMRTIAALSGVTTVRITPLSTTTAARALKITDPGGANYFVDYRTNSGLDKMGALNPWKPTWGVEVQRDDPTVLASTGSYELDASPTTAANDYNRTIPLAGTFTAASKRVTIKVTAQDATGATLTITNR
jgi:hypothetical protein